MSLPPADSAGIPAAKVLEILQDGELTLKGQLPYGSNYTFLVEVNHQENSLPAVYKPARGERPLWDFPHGSLARREVATFLLSERLGWGFVPPTVLREGPFGEGSLQFFVDADPEHHFFNFSTAEKRDLPWVAVFDFLINNADRKGGHFLIDSQRQLWLIDHGLTFHSEPKLRTVLWDYAGKKIPRKILQSLKAFIPQLEEASPLVGELANYLSAEEITHIARRTQHLLAEPIFPAPASRYSYPWPLV